MKPHQHIVAASAAVFLAAAACAQPAATDLGALSERTLRQTGIPVGSGSVVWFRFSVPAVSNANDYYLDILIEGAAGDSEIGLYDSAGNLVASDDDDGVSLRSALSFGSRFPVRPIENAVGGDGRDGDLAPGTYYLALASYDTTFLPTGFGVTSASAASSTYGLTLTLLQHYHSPFERWTEQTVGDAGNLPELAQPADGVGRLHSIRGVLDDSADVDMFQIQICDMQSFRASTRDHAQFDSQLWLFDWMGFGVAFNDDIPPGGAGNESTLTSSLLAQNGTYLLAISAFDRDAQDASGAAIWMDNPFASERAPDGPGAGNRIAGWSGGAGTGGQYIIWLDGVCFIGNPPHNCPSCVADYDQSGGVDGDDIFAFFSDWQAGAFCADVDGSGGVDGDDLPFFFDRWQGGSCG